MTTKAQLTLQLEQAMLVIASLESAPVDAPVPVDASTCERTKASFKKVANWKYHTNHCKSHTSPARVKTAPAKKAAMHDCKAVHGDLAGVRKDGVTPKSGHTQWVHAQAKIARS